MTVAQIAKAFEFSASHQLDGLSEDHPCSRLHGHNYRIRVILTGEVEETVGFVLDYRRLDTFKRWLDLTFDHRHLNEVMPGINPTAENIAEFLLEVLMFDGDRKIIQDNIGHLAVEVSETPKTTATVGRYLRNQFNSASQ